MGREAGWEKPEWRKAFASTRQMRERWAANERRMSARPERPREERAMLLKQVERELGRRERDVALSSGEALHDRPPGSSSSSDVSLDHGRGGVQTAAPRNRHAAQWGERPGARRSDDAEESPQFERRFQGGGGWLLHQDVSPEDADKENSGLRAVGVQVGNDASVISTHDPASTCAAARPNA
ncbi:hypothetical protein T484DRAFT_1892172, partial [Baffinella frigidus]